MSTATPAGPKAALLFARQFVQHPRLVGSVIPSSRFLVRRMLHYVPWAQARLIVEYGPGTGVFTRQILRRMRADATLVAIELGPEFVDLLGRQLPDPRLRLVQGSAADVETILADLGLGRPDCIISAIPFTVMPHAVRDAILEATQRVLPPDGRFLMLQFSLIMLKQVQGIFRRVTIRVEPLNIPPGFVYICRR